MAAKKDAFLIQGLWTCPEVQGVTFDTDICAQINAKKQELEAGKKDVQAARDRAAEVVHPFLLLLFSTRPLSCASASDWLFLHPSCSSDGLCRNLPRHLARILSYAQQALGRGCRPLLTMGIAHHQ